MDELHEETIKIISSEVTSAMARATATLTAKLARSMSNSRAAKLTRTPVSAQMKRKMNGESDATLDAPGGNLAPNDVVLPEMRPSGESIHT